MKRQYMLLPRSILCTLILGSALFVLGPSAASSEEAPKELGLISMSAKAQEKQGPLKEDLRKKIFTEAPKPDVKDTYNDYTNKLREWVQEQFRKSGLDEDSMKQAVKETMDKNVPKAVSAKTTAVGAPSSFSGRITDTIEDFLPLLGLSMDAVSTSDDKKSVTFKLKPLPFYNGDLNLRATAAEPTLFKSLADAIKEPALEAQRKALLADVSDFGDVTTALTYGYTRQGVSWETTRRMYGRNYDLYQPLVDDLLKSSWDAVKTKQLREAEGRLGLDFIQPMERLFPPKSDKEPSNYTFGQIQEAIDQGKLSFTREELLTAMLNSELEIVSIIDQVDHMNLDALPALVDNQPQLTLTASYRSSDQFVGPDTASVTLRYEMGSKNFNTMLNRYRYLMTRKEPGASYYKAFQDVTADSSYRAENKTIFTVTYKRTDPYKISHSYQQVVADPVTGEENKIPRTADINLKQSTEWSGNFVFTRFILRAQSDENKTGVELPRITLSVEGLWPQNDSERKKRVIGRLSYVMPATKGLSFPFTVTWASDPEFLKDQNRTFGAHLGLSYKLDGGN